MRDGYYCLTNELMNGDRWGWFAQKGQWELFKKFNVALYFAFRRHDLDIRLLASDESASPNPEAAKNVYSMLDWIRTNMGDYVGAYCTHWYVYGRKADDLNLWRESNASFSNLVQRALSSNAKRYILGEFGFSPTFGKRGVMVDDRSYNLRQPETCEESVLSKCEVGLAAMNQGAFACVSWSFVDYPDPFVIEDGDSPQERAVYEAGKCGYRLDTKYNKWGVFRWCSTDRDYRAYAELYAMGWLAKLFRKNATVLPCAFADPMLLLVVEIAHRRRTVVPPAVPPLRVRGWTRALQRVQRPAAARRHGHGQGRRVQRGAPGEVDHVPHHGLRGQATRRRDGTPHRGQGARLGAERGARTPLLPRVQGRQADRLHRRDLARSGRVAACCDRIGRNKLRPSRR